jgi:[acyl-carrier-protein] S-malonyltransferase
MGRDLAHRHPALFDRYFSAAEEAAGLPLRRYALEGPLAALTRTEVAQPALFALSLALTDLVLDAGFHPVAVAGHSLGEYAAAVACGALSPEHGLRLVCARGRLMSEVQDRAPGAMGAIIGLSEDWVRAACAEVGDVVVANLNTPTQVVVSGGRTAVDQLLDRARAAGAARALRLPVGAAFHSPAMAPVQERLEDLTRELRWSDPLVPLVANATGAIVRRAEYVRRVLLDQITAEVRWVQCVQTLCQTGCHAFLELGNGSVLSGLVGQIAPGTPVFPASTPQQLEEL